MGDAAGVLFTETFVTCLRSLIEARHELYPRIPPQGIFFESLVERETV